MENSQKSIIFLCVLSFLFGSCAPVYLPPAAHIPQFSKKGETQIAVHAGTNGADLQAAHSLGNSFALMGTFSTNLGTGETNQHIYGEIAGGFFKPTESIVRLSAYGGFGMGTATGESSWTFNGSVITDQASASLYRAFIQGNTGVSSGIVDFGLATRLVFIGVSYSEKNFNPVPPETVTGFLVEPVLSLGLGSPVIKAVGQFGLSLPIEEQIDFEYNPILISLGLQFSLPTDD